MVWKIEYLFSCKLPRKPAQLECKQRIKFSFDLRHLSEFMKQISVIPNFRWKTKQGCALRSSYEIHFVVPTRKIVCKQCKQCKQWKAEQNLYKKKEKSLRKCWLVYADSPVKVLPKLLLWKLMWKTHTTPHPSTSGLLSVQPRVLTAVSLRCALSKTRWRCVFPTTAVTHILTLKKKKVHCCIWTTTFTLLSDNQH